MKSVTFRNGLIEMAANLHSSGLHEKKSWPAIVGTPPDKGFSENALLKLGMRTEFPNRCKLL